MKVNQCKFFEYADADREVFGGFLIDDGTNKYVICGCCGNQFDFDAVEIVEIYEDWIPLSYRIIQGWN